MPSMKVSDIRVSKTIIVEINAIQGDLIEKGLKKAETLRISEEELMLKNHRCCY
jgi:hypothetical protein